MEEICSGAVADVSTCEYYAAGVCLSCNLIDLPYEQQLALKEKKLKEFFLDGASAQLASVGSQLAALVQPVVGCQRAWGSRNKAKMVVSGFAHAPVVGINDAHYNGHELLNCALHHETINKILVSAHRIIQSCGIPPYNIKRRRGELKFIIVRQARGTEQCMVRLVLRSKVCLERAKRFAELLRQECPQVCVFSVNIQPKPAAIIEGEEELVITEQKGLIEKLGSWQLVFAPQSFSQVTSEVAEKLYSYVATLIEKKKPAKMLDLFCGSGGFAIFCSPHAGQITGVEITAGAIQTATQAAKLNKIANANFICADALEYLKELSGGAFDALVVNPPRRGLSPEIVAQLKRIAPQQIVYSSCNPETLKENLLELSDCYQVESLRPFDMFPMTDHLEVVASLRRI